MAQPTLAHSARRVSALCLPRLRFLLVPVLSLATWGGSHAADLSWQERIDAQAAIEQVYQRHRLAAPAGVEVGREVLERKVRTYLEESAALEEIWGQPITAAALRRELERIARDTRYPDRLAEIYDALGGDPRLLLECFARPVLANRMARSFHSLDPTIEASWDEWLAEVRPRLHPERVAAVVTARENLPVPRGHGRSTLETTGATEATEACLANDTWNNQSLDDFPEGRLDPAAVWTGTEMIVWGGTMRSGARYDPLLDHWTILSRAGAPTATGPAVWTGSEMIVWAGGPEEVPGRYSPVTDAWQPVSLAGAPTADYRQAAAWVGNRMVVWDAHAQQGGRYDPATDTWAPVSTVGAPSPRYYAAAVGAGNRLLIWGGIDSNNLNTGGQYDPATDVWTPTSISGAPAGGQVSAAVWTGTRMIVWRSGGGGMYDPGSNAWSAISTTGQPSPRSDEKAVWTGAQMIVWGGRASGPLSSGARYDPASNLWTPMSTAGAPLPRYSHAALWDGARMIVWGGEDGFSQDSGGRYDPLADAWTPVSQGSGPQAREAHAMIWTGSEIVIWGGAGGGITGARYDPLTDSWTATTLAGVAAAAASPIAFWTGRYLLVYSDYLGHNNSGGRYDPAADAWLPISAAGAPPPWFARPAATWTGNRMFVIGLRRTDAGEVAAFYNPEVDAWTPISLVGAPYIPLRGTVVWTGTRAILFGGSNGSDGALPGLGAMFDPVAGTWSMTSQEGEPAPRVDHEAIWTGDRMLVWGGINHVLGGGLYDPVADRWTPIAQPEWLQPTSSHSLVWTGDRMIVWGGAINQRFCPGCIDTRSSAQDKGAVYDPVTDTWSPTSLVGAPAPRSWHGAVWTGGEMIIWGGSLTRTGGRYALGQADDRDGDGVSFCAGDCDDADPAVHPGAAEICDGRDNDCNGVLLPAEGLDLDLDLAPACSDCADLDPRRYPGALEYCDGIDNDCDGVTDETDLDGDGTFCATDCDDTDSTTYPGAPEANDGVDNQCPGDPGFGVVDEVSGSLAFPSGNTTLCWPAQAGATLYEVLRAADGAMSSDCVLATSASSCFTDPAAPASRAQYAYLVRAVAPSVGSWGFRSSGAERIGLCGVEWNCNDGTDDDGDGKIDCADTADCFRRADCSTAAFSFQDTAGDNVPSQALQQFLSAVATLPGDYLEFSLHGSGINFDLCAARADFYRDAYLSFAPTDGVASSGAWEKWTRIGGGTWTGPVLAPFENWFGDSCTGAWSWCPEPGLAGMFPGIAPAETNACETFENIDCGDGSWTLTVTVGVDRPSACGF